jgi:thiol-disulfide isomerase/thioredoxin
VSQPKHTQRKQPPALLIFAGIALLVLAVIALKSGKQAPAVAVSLEEQYNQALQEKYPTFVFLHSLDCIPCKEMMDVVAEVQPEFEGQVMLIDVDVYDQRNVNIMRQEALQMIPTLVFYDRQGQRQVQVGVLQPVQLRAVLRSISGAN